MTPPPSPTHTTPPRRLKLPELPDSGRVRDVYNFVAAVLAVLTMVAAFSGVGWSWQNARADHRQDQQAIRDNQANAVTQCKNANESRDASRTLWFFVVDLASKGAAPTEAAYLSEVRHWIGDVYQPHDCGQLDRKYPIPDPPVLSAAS